MNWPVRRNTDVLKAYVTIEGSSFLDVGCGRGALVGWMRKHGAYAIGIDPQAYLLQAPAIAARGDALPIRDKAFDHVIFFNSLHHIAKASMERALQEAARVARSNVIIVEPIAAGSHFLAMQPIDDETEVRAQAYEALKTTKALEMVAETEWQLDYIEENLEDALAGMIRVDPGRKARIEQVRDELERLFYHYGRPVERGMAFDQPMRLNLMKPRVA